ncbi:MAG: hemolysin family protein, partial [Acutalibacteraceae bacterium]
MPDESGGNKSFIERLFGSKNKETVQQETEEEILSLVEEGKEKGIIEDTTKSIIKNVFNFDDTTASEIMTHRTELTAFEDTTPLKEVVDIAIEKGHSRIPVFHEDIDNICGILYVKDLLKFVCEDVPKDFKLTDILREALFVPKGKNCASLFAEMTKKKIQMAIVVDEYGGTEGVITMEDIIESILGNIQDEYDNEEEEIRKISETKFTFDGSTTIDDVEDAINLKIPASDCDTIAGFVLENIGRIPKSSEHPVVKTDELKITVLDR